MADVKLFLSCVSDEFSDYREALRRALTRPNVEIKIQEDFKALGGDTLAMLEVYVGSCDVVVHFVGDMAGSTPKSTSVDDLLRRRPELVARLAEKGMDRAALGRLTYTQWEAWLAVGFNDDGAKRNLVTVAPADGLERGKEFKPTNVSRASQVDHLARLRAINLYPAERFTSTDNLVAQVYASAVFDALQRTGTAPKLKPRNLPFISLGGLFAGRQGTLEKLRATTGKGAPVAVHGLGGIGKTRLAIEYGWTHEANYSALLFVNASDGAALNVGLAALTADKILDLPEKEARDDATKITAVLRWLESNQTWLMILDNVDDKDAVAEVAKLLPRLKGGHVVITARASNFPTFVQTLEVSTLDENVAAQFLLARTAAKRSKSKDDETLARTLARELGGLALGVEQAGAQIATDRVGFARYLKLWTESREKALAWADGTVTGSDRTLATTWATSVARLSPESRRLLDRLAFLAPDPIPDSLLDVAVPGEADADAYEARSGLYAYSLISGVTADDGDEPGFIVHRLVQDFARRAMSEERRAEALREALEWVSATFVGDPSDVRNWPVLDQLAPHALAVVRTADAAEIAEPTGRLFNQLGLLLLLNAQARYAEAEPLMRRALAIGETSYGPDHPKVAIRLVNLALLLQDTNRLAEAEPLMRRALAIREKSYGADHPDIAQSLNNLAALLYSTNSFAEAESLYRRALAIFEKSLGSDHPLVATGLNNLAQLLQATNRLVEAEPLMRRALAINEKSRGPDHPEVAGGLNNLAQLLQATNHLVEAEPMMRRALAISETSYGPDHPKVATCLSNLAGLLQATNRLVEAEPMMRRALAISETSYGPDHPTVATCLNNLAGLLQDTNRLVEAEPMTRRALAILEKSLGSDHPGVATGLNNLADLLQAANRPAEAEPLMRRALEINEKGYGRDHPDVATGLSNLALLLQDTRRLAEAEPLMRRALAIDGQSYGPDHPNVARRLNNLARLLHATNRTAEAASLLRRALAIFETGLGPDHPNTMTVRNNLAGLEAELAKSG